MTHVNACKVTTIFAKFNDKTLLFFNICHQKTPESTIFDMYITLRERNLDVVLIQCVIDAAQYLTLHQRLFGDVNFMFTLLSPSSVTMVVKAFSRSI